MAKVFRKLNKQMVLEAIKARQSIIEDLIFAELGYVGESFVRNARISVSNSLGLEDHLDNIKSVPTNAATGLKTFTDQTGNLRSSIGYIILKDGKQVGGSDFSVVKKGEEGAEAGRQLVKQLSEKYQGHRGFVLICVAGMDYAAAVEANGFDVITGSSVQAVEQLRSKMSTLAVSLKSQELE